MGFTDWFLGRTPGNPVSTPAAQRGVISPWAEGELSKVVWSDVFSTDPQFITREEALSIPAVAKARALLISLIADKPLKAYRAGAELPTQPTFLYRTDGDVSPWHRMAMTVDDLFFSGWSLWAVNRGAAGQITAADRVPMGVWEFDDKGRILIKDENGTPRSVDSERVVLIPGPNEGLIKFGSRTLNGAIAMERAWVKRAEDPIPLLDLHQTDSTSNISPQEAAQLVADWNAARAKGATAFTPYDVDARVMGETDPALFIEGRNFLKIDVANFAGLPAALLDGSLAQSTLTYSTQEDHRNEVMDYALPYWIGPIEGRLSQDDVVPAGQSVHFDFSRLTTPTNPPFNETED